MPSMPIFIGRMIRNGIKNRNCLVSERNAPFIGFPIEVKNVVEWLTDK